MRINIKNYKNILPVMLELKKSNEIENNIPIMLWGKHGVGKSTITRSIGVELNYRVVTLNLANQTPEELLGYPDGKGGYLLPDWLEKDSEQPGSYFLDEINRAPKYVLQAMFNFINEGRIHKHQINPRDYVMAAANPSDGEYDVTDFEDPAFLSRFCHLYLEPTHEEYMKYLSEKGAHKGMLAFLADKNDIINNETSDEFMIEVKPDNRALDRVDSLLKIMSETQINTIGFSIFSGLIGLDNADMLITAVRESCKLPTMEEILDGKLDFDNEDMDVIVVVNEKLVDYMKTNKMFEVVKGSTKNMTKKQVTSVKKYLKYIPEDSATSFLKVCLDRVGLEVMDFFNIMDEKLLDNLLNEKISN